MNRKENIKERGLTLFSTGKYNTRKEAEKAAIAELKREEEKVLMAQLERLDKNKLQDNPR